MTITLEDLNNRLKALEERDSQTDLRIPLLATHLDLEDIVFPPMVRVYNSGDIAIANATDVYLTFDSERFDTGAIHSTSSNTGRLTCRIAGKYIITGAHYWATNTTERRTLRFIRMNCIE